MHFYRHLLMFTPLFLGVALRVTHDHIRAPLTDIYAYEYSMGVTAHVIGEKNNVIQPRHPNDALIARSFRNASQITGVGDWCHPSTELQMDMGVWMMLIHGNGKDEGTPSNLTYYDGQTGTVWSIEETIMFRRDTFSGTATSPVHLHFTTNDRTGVEWLLQRWWMVLIAITGLITTYRFRMSGKRLRTKKYRTF